MTPKDLDYYGQLMKQVLEGHVGRTNAIPVPELARMVGLSASRDYRDVREVREHIEGEYPVLSDASGMWKYEDPQEAIDVEASLLKTGRKIFRRYSRIRRQRRRNHPNWQPPLWREKKAA